MNTRSLVAVILLLALPIHVFAGTITGTVRAEGVQSDAEDGSEGAYASRKFKFTERMDYGGMKDFVVYIDGPVEGVARSTNRAEIITQKDASFNPRILPVAVGTTVEWPNRDDIYHNVFSFSEPKPFDLGLYKDEMKHITFDQPGRVDVFCAIHKNMNCIILVLENPFFARTDNRGRYSIADVPAGTYQIKVWHERMPPQTKEVIVPESGTVTVDMVMGITGLPKY